MEFVHIEKCVFGNGSEIEISRKVDALGKVDFLAKLTNVFNEHENKREELCKGLSEACKGTNASTEQCPLAGKAIGCPFWQEGDCSPTWKEWRACLVGMVCAQQRQKEKEQA